MSLWTAVILGVVVGIDSIHPRCLYPSVRCRATSLFSRQVAKTFDGGHPVPGAILAAGWLYRWSRPERLWRVGKKFAHRNQGLKGLRGCLLLGLTTLPALLAGKFAYGSIKAHLFNAASVAVALAVGGVGILLVERRKETKGIVSLDRLPVQAGYVALMLFEGLSLAR